MGKKLKVPILGVLLTSLVLSASLGFLSLKQISLAVASACGVDGDASGECPEAMNIASRAKILVALLAALGPVLLLAISRIAISPWSRCTKELANIAELTDSAEQRNKIEELYKAIK